MVNAAYSDSSAPLKREASSEISIDNANNNKNFVQQTPCTYTLPE